VGDHIIRFRVEFFVYMFSYLVAGDILSIRQ